MKKERADKKTAQRRLYKVEKQLTACQKKLEELQEGPVDGGDGGSGGSGGSGGGARTVKQVCDKVARRIIKDRVRLGDAFRDFDRLRHGKVTQHQLATVLSVAGFRLNDDEVALIARAFEWDGPARDASGHKLVNWREFLLEVDADADISIGGSTRSARRLSDAERTGRSATGGRITDDVNSLPYVHRGKMEEIATQVRTRGVLMLPAFQAQDRHNRGQLMEKRFRSIMAGLGFKNFGAYGPSAAAFNALLQNYVIYTADGEPTSDINYSRFVKHIAQLEASAGSSSHVTAPGTVLLRRSSASSSLSAAERGYRSGGSMRAEELLMTSTAHGIAAVAARAADSLDDLMAELRSQATERRVRVADFFEDADPLRHGVLSASKFASALSTAGLRVNSGQLAALIASFRDDHSIDLINWRNFVRELDGEEELEKDPLSTVRAPPASLAATVLDASPATPAGVDGAQLRRLLSNLAARVRKRRVLLVDHFKDRDRAHTQTVTVTQFASVLSFLGFELAEADVELLAKVFKSTKYDDRINYRAFCDRVDTRRR
eukprot:PLAT227.4.p2 GENE.PLAT227.4~~PLAT227.4.p2  ORF type:complete len:548 (-),score=334.39 PLAT227.4:99-1742(-)